MNALIRFAVSQWQFSLLMAVLVVALGVDALMGMPRTEDPQLAFPAYQVIAVLPGATPQDIEQQVTKPSENALAGLDDLREIKSTSGDSSADIVAEYVWGTNPDRKYDEVVREINALRPKLPAGVTRLDVIRMRPSTVPFLQLALTSDILPMRSFDKLARDLRDRVARIHGIRKAEVLGAPPSELRVGLDMQRLAALGIPATAVVEALRAGGVDTPIGTVNAGARRFNLRYAGAYGDASSVANIPITTANGRPVRVVDVAEVAWASREAGHVVRFNGRRALLLTFEQGDGQDVAQLTAKVEAEMARFKTTLPGSVKLERGFAQADNVHTRLARLTRDFVLAFVIVSITLLPLGWRAAGVVMIAIPVSLLIGVAVLAHSGFGLNQLAVAGFVLSLGLLVDDAIVVVENVARWLRDGASPTEAAIGATTQITRAILGCTACLMLAFLPLLALPEGSGEFIRSIPVAVLGTVGGSLLVALTLVPFAASRILKPGQDPHGNALLQRLNAGIERFYAPVLHRSLDRPWRALGVIFLLASLAVPLLIVIGSSLFPAADLPQFLVKVEMPRGTALATTDVMVARVEQRLRAEPSIAWTTANAGRGNPSLYYNSHSGGQDPAQGEVGVGFKAWDPRSSPQVLDKLRTDFAHFPGARIRVITFVQGALFEAPVSIRIVGPDIATLARLANRGEQTLRALPELRDIGNPLRVERSDLELVVDEPRAQALGVPAGALRQAVQLAMGGVTPATSRDADGDEYPVTVRLPMRERSDITALGHIQVPTSTGASVPLSALATTAFRSGPAEIDRNQRERVVTLSAYVKDGYLTSRATETALAALQRDLRLPPGYALRVAGEAESQSRSFAGLGPAIATAAIGMLAVLVLEFGTFRNVLVVAGVVPLGLFGAVVALWLTGNSLSFTASVGLIALVGIEIKNSILLVDFAEQVRRDGMDVRAAVERAGELRFLPVLLTSITAIGGLLPLAIEGNGLYSPMAIAMIGGLVTSTLLSRIATPVMYLLLASRDDVAKQSAQTEALA